MQYVYGVATDVGNRKKINQDAILVETAETQKGDVLFAIVCDGMGGLASGEKASEEVIAIFEEWFEQELPEILSRKVEGVLMEYIKHSISKTVDIADAKVSKIGTDIDAECGTTAAILLIIENKWLVMNIGDSRIYRIHHDEINQVTKDHSYVQREIDKGQMTEEEAEKSPMRSVLLQCIGAGDMVVPDWFSGTVSSGDSFLLCSDGFRHKLKKEEMKKRLSVLDTEDLITEELLRCIDDIKEAKERDNITVAFIRCF